MKPRIIFIITLLTLFISPFSTVQAQSAAGESLMLKPVMIVRFNQDHVYFQKQLATVIRSAIKAKPDVVFDVIQYVPNQAENGEYDSSLQTVLSGFLTNGIAKSRLQASMQSSQDVSSAEVYIYVR